MLPDAAELAALLVLEADELTGCVTPKAPLVPKTLLMLLYQKSWQQYALHVTCENTPDVHRNNSVIVAIYSSRQKWHAERGAKIRRLRRGNNRN